MIWITHEVIAIIRTGISEYALSYVLAPILVFLIAVTNGDAQAMHHPYPGVRYIDFEQGSDRNPGTRELPWKHHPWDRNTSSISASAEGIHTYVFKKGVIYRGALVASMSGQAGAPITLTVEPGWGQGAAVLAGSQAYNGGWQLCEAVVTRNLPENSRTKVWCMEVKVEHKPQLLWEVGVSGITRIPLARSPNWEISDSNDPRSQWFELSDVIVELPVYVDNTSNVSIGDSLSVYSKRSAFNQRKKQEAYPSIKVIGVSQGLLTVSVHNWSKHLIQAGDFLSNGKTEIQIKRIGGTHSIIRRLVDPSNLTAAEVDVYAGATVWAERRSMPKADAAIVVSSNPVESSIRANFHRTAGSGPMQYDRYYLEGLPEFLDSPGEYFYQSTGSNLGMLVLRLPDDRDPNKSIIESATTPVILDINNHSNIEISGLDFRFSNQVPPGSAQARHSSLHASAIQIRGDVNNIRISNCNFAYLPAGIVVFPEDRAIPSILDNIQINDNTFSEIDGSPIVLGNGQGHFKLKKNGSRLVHVDILRNKLEKIGYRTLGNFGVGSHGDGIQVMGGEVVEVAGNQVDQVWGSGISVRLGSGYEHGEVARPFLRSLIHNNTIIDSLLGAQDGGGINSWMGGPSYIYNNISGNPVGCMYSRYKTTTRKNWYRRGCYGVGIYLDGQYKGYVFNNIVWGNNNNVNDRIYNSAAFNEAMGFMNTVFNNTFYRFGIGLHKGMFQHNRNYYLGNLFIDMGLGYIEHEPREDSIDYSTLAFSYNQFYGQTKWFGKLGKRNDRRYSDIESWRNAMRRAGLMNFDTGTVLTSNPLVDVAGHDFHPIGDSPVIDKGVKVFVPWALYEVVGEWHFLRRNDKPAIINGENINMDSRWARREMFHLIPRNDLQCVNTDVVDFENGILEDWIPGSLRFDGKTRYCTLTDVAIEKGLPGNKMQGGLINAGKQAVSVDIGSSNFLIEAVIAPDAGAEPVGLVKKLGDRGYSLQINTSGLVELVLDYGSSSSQRTSLRRVNDGQWHHVLVDIDRSVNEGINIYIDGRLSNGNWSGAQMKTTSLSNTAEFIVGRSDTGFFKGKIDFLRLSRGSLAQAETNIEELYKWEFDGPYLYDYYGKLNNIRDVGAVEYDPD